MMNKLTWINSLVVRVSGDIWLGNEYARMNHYKVGEAAEILWDVVSEINYLSGRSTTEFNPRLWNKDTVGTWYRDLGKIDFGVK